MLFVSAVPLPPLRATRFPYTTLFRSREQQLRDDFDRFALGLFDQRRILGQKLGRLPLAVSSGIVGVRRALPEDTASGSLDRKSTRLNSSHRCISYAVFCLKKKNNNIT